MPVEADDPRRCQENASNSRQCPIQAIEGSLYCRAHQRREHGCPNGARNALIRRYRLSSAWARTEDLAGMADYKDLKEEIIILRVMMEEIMNTVTGPFDMMVQSPRIIELVQNIARTVNMSHKLEMSMGNLLDRASIMTIADNVIRILAENVKDEVVLKKVAGELGAVIQRVSEASARTVTEDK